MYVLMNLMHMIKHKLGTSKIIFVAYIYESLLSQIEVSYREATVLIKVETILLNLVRSNLFNTMDKTL